MILNYIKNFWKLLSRISPDNRNIIIFILLGYIMYSQINQSTHDMINNLIEKNINSEKKAEQYTKDTANQINQWVRLIQQKDWRVSDVLLLSYHNNTQSLQGYKYLYLSCLVEAPRSLDTPLLKQQWNNIDYIYYADELTKIHNQQFVMIQDSVQMKVALPKMFHLLKTSNPKSVAFFALEKHDRPIGMIIIFYSEIFDYTPKDITSITKITSELVDLLDYENAI